MDYKTLVQNIVEQVLDETIATMMDVQPITCVGQEHPAKKERENKDKNGRKYKKGYINRNYKQRLCLYFKSHDYCI